MTEQIKYSKRLEIRLTPDEMETLNKMANGCKISKSRFVRILIEMKRKANDQHEKTNTELQEEVAVLKTVIEAMRDYHDKMIG